MSDAPAPVIEQRLAALVPRLRALRVARGGARALLAALAAASLVVLLDAAFPLPAWARGLLLSVWLTAAGVLVWRGVLVPWRADVPLTEVASELERVLPELGERLRVVVSEPPPGQPESLRAALRADAARRAKAVDLVRALPVKPVARVVACAVAVVLAVVAAAALVPGSGDRIRRVAQPWYRPPAAAFRIVVTSGEPVVRRGDPVTLSAYAERTGGGTPTEAVIVFRTGPSAPETREPMSSDGGAFHFKRSSAVTDFEYRVEMGTARSDWFRVTALDPVELAPGTRIEIVPPEYATPLRKRTLTTFTDIEGPAFGTVHFHLTFTRPAAAVHFDWRPADAAHSDPVAVDLAPDGLGATATFPLRDSGALKLVLVRDADGKRLRTETAVSVRVARDEPPWFEEVSGVTARLRTARPGSRVPIAFVARDDMSVTGAALVYVVGPDESRRVTIPIALTGGGTTQATGRIDFDLSGKGNEGDTLRFRIEVTDNRRAEAGGGSGEPAGGSPVRAGGGSGEPAGGSPVRAGGPQVAVYPPVGWSELKLTAAAPPLEQQNIVCARDALAGPLAALATEAREAADEAAALRAATTGEFPLTGDQSARLSAAREKVRAAAESLAAAARDAALVPELRPLAGDVQRVAALQFRSVADALRRAESDTAARADALTAAAADLGDAHGRLNELLARNAKLGRDRLDRARLLALAADQTALADAASTGGADVLARQNELITRLAANVADSDSLRAAVGAAKYEDARRLAAALADLATRLRDLDAAARESADEVRAGLGADITRDQELIAKRAAVIFGGLDTAARLAGVAPPRPDEFRRVADLAAAGKTVEALTELEKHTQTIGQLTAAFETWVAERADPKLAAKQFALWQDDLLARFGAATKETPFDKLPDETKAAFRAEQKGLHAAVEALALPPEVAKARETALFHTRRADRALATDGTGAGSAMKFAIDGLQRLAAQTPAVADRHRAALRALEPLRQELDSSGNAVDLVFRTTDLLSPEVLAKKLSAPADRQRKLIAGVSALDLPGLSSRQARVLGALAAAVGDLRDGSPLDIPASQARVRREFERLKLVLEGNPAVDAKAAELHHTLAALAAGLEAHGPALARPHLEPAVPVLQEAGHQLTGMIAPEAPALMNDARTAVQSAELAVRDAKPDEGRRRVRAAADAVGKLADRLNGFESDLERLNRLSANRRLAMEKPKEILSDDAQRQLAREGEELAHTRVGPAGQALKKRALDLYAKLRAKADPDRLGTDQKALVTTLDELAAKTADISELAVTDWPRSGPAVATGADLFLPSKPHAEALRDLGAQVRGLRVRVARFGPELAARLHPTAANPLAPLEARQRALAVDALALVRAAGLDPAPKAADAALLAAERVRVGRVLTANEAGERAAAAFRQLATVGGNKPWGKRATELAARQEEITAALGELLNQPGAIATQQVARAEELGREGGELAFLLDSAARTFGPDDATGQALRDAAKRAHEVETRLLEAAKKAAESNTSDAEALRAAAEMAVRDAADALARAAPPRAPEDVHAATGDALRVAEKAMRTARDALASGGNIAAAPAMRDAARVLTEAAKRVGE